MNFAQWNLAVGAALLLSGGAMLFFPGRVTVCLNRFPRDVWAGRVLSTLAWAGAAAASMQMGWDFLEPYKRYAPLIALACIPMTWWALDNLLACRAWGGMLCLFPLWFLAASRMCYSPWRLLPVIFAYACIIKGMFVILYPWLLRRELSWTTASFTRIKIIGAARAGLGIVFAILAWLQF